MRDAFGQPLHVGDTVAIAWQGGTLAKGEIVEPSRNADQYKARHDNYIYVEEVKSGRKVWKTSAQVALTNQS